jgi:uncharacterized membrane protein YdcZ (DUF606 family)
VALGATVLTAPALLLPRTGLSGTLLVIAASLLLVPALLNLFARAPFLQALSPVFGLKDVGATRWGRALGGGLGVRGVAVCASLGRAL